MFGTEHRTPEDEEKSLRTLAILGKTVRNHKHMSTLLTTAPPQLRNIIYEVLKANVKFQAWPLDRYVSAAGEMAEREQLPILDALGNMRPFQPASDVKSVERAASEAIATNLAARTLTMVCGKCMRMASFVGLDHETPADVTIRARLAGWVYDYRSDPAMEICPECPTSLRKETQSA